MEWIKAKYDRLLLGICGVIALLVGGLLVMNVMGFKKQFPQRDEPKPKTDFGTTDALKSLEAAKARLAEVVAIKPPVKDGKPIGLFVSAPVLKTAENELVAVLDPAAKQVRAPIDNLWLYENDLDITRSDIAEIDNDGDGFSNTEEFMADPKSNPRDKKSTPPPFAKLAYKECVKDELSLKFNTYISDTELSFRRTKPADKAFNTPFDLKVGDSFPAEKGSMEMRFKAVKVDATNPDKPVATVDDLLTDTPDDYKIELKQELELPTRKAKIVSSLGTPEEKIVISGEEFSFTVNPDYKYKILSVTDEEVALEAGPEKTPVKLKIN
jgi:hypothetical protein